MTKIAYERWDPNTDTITDLVRAESIINEYRSRGYVMTLRQLYYQFVARDFIPNSDRSYKRLGSIVNRGRMAGRLDWDAIEDRTRNLQTLAHWDTPGGVIEAAAASYRNDLWADQDYRVEVWVEKEALAGVIDRIASRWDCPWFSCRGYVSQSELWGAGQRLGRYVADGKRVVVLHLGDHDPSGIDMTRDIADRLRTFILGDAGERLGWGSVLTADDDYPDCSEEVESELLVEFARQRHDVDMLDVVDSFEELVEVRRIALNMEQVREWNPPPNPAKLTDSRAGSYIADYGRQSWELDALPPDTLASLIDSHIAGIVDHNRYGDAHESQERDRELLVRTSNHWGEVAAYVEGMA